MVLFVVSWFWLLERWHWLKLLSMLCVGCLWTLARDTNAWIILLLAGLLLIWQRASRRYIFVAAVFIALFAVNETSQNFSDRWVMPFVNVLGRRILPDTQARDYFAQRGMPTSGAVMRLSGFLAWHQDRLFYRDPDLHELREWIQTHGKRTYVTYLLAHPVTALISPFRDAKELIAPDLKYYRYPGFSPILSGVLADTVYVEQYPRLLAFGPLIIILVIAFIRTHGVGSSGAKHHHLILISSALILVFYPHAVIAWHGDANDVGRHALLASVHLRLGLWFLFIFSLDWLLISENRSKLKSLRISHKYLSSVRSSGDSTQITTYAETTAVAGSNCETPGGKLAYEECQAGDSTI
jgi:hypothetical protein